MLRPEPGSWSPGSLVELWGGTVVFHDAASLDDPSLELLSTMTGPSETLGTVLSSTVLVSSMRNTESLGKQAYVLLLAGRAVGWVNLRSVRRTLDEGRR